jgi:hypothetical protein
MGANRANGGCVTRGGLGRKMRVLRGTEGGERLITRLSLVLMEANEISDYYGTVDDVAHDSRLRELRMRFLLSEINEEHFKQRVQRLEKAHSKQTERANVFGTYGNLSRALLTNFVHSPKASRSEVWLEAENVLAQIRELAVVYINALDSIDAWYGHPSHGRNQGHFDRALLPYP